MECTYIIYMTIPLTPVPNYLLNYLITYHLTDLEDDDDSGNVYDSVPEMIEEDSLEEKMSFGAEYDTSEAGNSPPPPLPITPPPYMLLPENKDKIQILKSASSSSSNSQFSRNNNNHNNLTSAQNNSTTTQPSSILSAEDFHSKSTTIFLITLYNFIFIFIYFSNSRSLSSLKYVKHERWHYTRINRKSH